MITSTTRCSVYVGILRTFRLYKTHMVGLYNLVNVIRSTLFSFLKITFRDMFYYNISKIEKSQVTNSIVSEAKVCIELNSKFKKNITIFFLFSFFSSANFSFAQTETFESGAYIVDMGVTPQTDRNALKPYGMIYDLIKNYKVKIKWCINPSKAKDGIDFSHNGVNYKGGPFIIPVEYRTTEVNARINYWITEGVVGATTISPIMVSIDALYGTLKNVPRWTLDKRNGKLAVEYFINASIPPNAYGGNTGSGWENPSDLDCCDDLFVLPHAEPSWAVHQRLYSWNLDCRGGLWDGCTSGSAIENMVNPENRDEQTNFLTTKDPAYKGSSGIYANSNTLMLWGTHKDGSPPYTHRLPADPVSQYIGTTDAAHTNGAEQIYIPRQTAGTTARWNPTTKIIAYDPSHSNVPTLHPDLRNVAAVMMYGRGFGDENRGFVMHSSGHSYDKSQSSPAHVAAQRAFFNFSWMVATDKAENLNIVSSGGGPAFSGIGRGLSFELPQGNVSDFTIEWSSTCGGTFSPNANTQTLEFIPPPTADVSGCVVTVSLTDRCGRTTTSSQKLAVLCDFKVNPTRVNPSCKGSLDGSINFTLSGSSVLGANDYVWTRENPIGNGSGTGEQISNLVAGTYHVTVTSNTGCSATFTTLLVDPNDLTLSTSTRDYLCFGQSGAISLNVVGGLSPYTYIWNNSKTTKNLENAIANTYIVTVTDQNGCSKSTQAEVSGPNTVFIAGISKTDVSCFGMQDGTISLTHDNGSSNYFYQWSDGQFVKDRESLASGAYAVTISDNNGCSRSLSIAIAQPQLLAIEVARILPSCPTNVGLPYSGDGAIDISVIGGEAPYTFLWSDGIMIEDRNNLPEGEYSIQVTDSKGCIANKSITLFSTSSVPGVPTRIND